MYEMRLYILDIRKPYHEDEDGYAGAWFNCPVDLEEIKERLGVEHEEDFEIADYELPFALMGNQCSVPHDTGNRGHTCGK